MFVNVTSFKICSKYFLFLSLYIGCKEEKAALMPMLPLPRKYQLDPASNEANVKPTPGATFHITPLPI